MEIFLFSLIGIGIILFGTIIFLASRKLKNLIDQKIIKIQHIQAFEDNVPIERSYKDLSKEVDSLYKKILDINAKIETVKNEQALLTDITLLINTMTKSKVKAQLEYTPDDDYINSFPSIKYTPSIYNQEESAYLN